MAVDIDTLQIQIEAESTKAVERLNALADAIERIGNKMKTTGFLSIVSQIRGVGNAAADSAKAVGSTKIQQRQKILNDARQQTLDTPSETFNAAKFARELRQIDVQIEKTEKKLDSLQSKLEVLQETKGLGNPLMQSGTASQIRQLEAEIQEVSAIYDALDAQRRSLWSSFQDQVGNTAEADRATEKVNILSRALEKIGSFRAKPEVDSSDVDKAVKKAGILQKALKSVASGGFGALKTGMKSVGSYMLTSFTKPFTKAIGIVSKWKNSLGRIAFYRAIRAAISAVTSGFKEGIGNLYQYSRLVGTEFAPAMNSLSTSAQYLKNSLGAMAAPLIQVVAPAVDYLISKFVALLNIIGKVFAALSGKSTYSQAVKQAKEYAEATGGAADAAQEFLLGIDELNVIDPTSGSGGGAIGDYATMFEEVEVPVETQDWAARIKQAIEDGDWQSVGAIFADKLNSIVDSWDSYAWGASLGEKIKNGLNAAYGFMTTFDFGNLGSKIADSLNGVFDAVDWNLLGRTFTSKLTALWDMVIGFAKKLNWGSFGQSIGELVRGALDEASEWIASVDWSAAVTSMWDNLKSFVENVDIGATVQSFINFFSSVIGAVAEMVGTLDLGQIVYTIFDWIAQAVTKIDISGLLKNIGLLIVEIVVQIPGIVVGAVAGISDLVGAIFEDLGLDSIAGFFYGIADGLKNVGAWLKEHLVDPVVNWVKDLFGIHSPSTVFAEIGNLLIEGLLNGISEAWSSIVDFFGEKVDAIKENLSEAWDSIKETASEKWESVKTTLSGIWENIKQAASGTWSNLKATISGAWDSIKGTATTKLTETKNKISEAWDDVKTTASEKWENIKTTLSNAWSSLKTTASTKFNELKSEVFSIWDDIKTSATTWGSDICSNLASGIKSAISTVTSAVSTVAEEIQNFLGFSEPDAGPLSNFHTFMPDMLELMAKGIKENAYLAVNAVSDLADSVANVFTGIGATELQFPVHEDAYIHYGIEFADGQPRITENNDSSEGFTAGIRDANEEIVATLYAIAAQIVEAINNQEQPVFSLDGKQILQSAEKAGRQRGVNIMPGGVTG